MYLDFDCVFKIVLNCNNDKNSVLQYLSVAKKVIM